MTSTTIAADLPVSLIPVSGFDRYSSEAANFKFKDETVMERNRWAVEHDTSPQMVPQCHATNNWDDRGFCTRPADHHGMHFAGNKEHVIGAW